MTAWTEAEDEVVKRAYADGVQPAFIYLEGRSRKSICGRAFRLGLSLPGNTRTNIQRIAVMARDKEIARLFRDGLSIDRISARVGFQQRAVQRSLVRSGLQLKRESPNPKARPMNGYSRNGWHLKRRELVPLKVERHEPFDGNPVTLLELKNWSCRWPIDLPDDTPEQRRFCNAKRMHDLTPYCEEHHNIAYVGLPQRKRRTTDNGKAEGK